MDGQRNHVSCADTPIEITISTLKLPLAQRTDYEHFAVVRTKLHWSGGFIEKK
jgi:NAD+ kinase